MGGDCLICQQPNTSLCKQTNKSDMLAVLPQVLAVLEAMGGSLKSTDEEQALQQEEAAKKGSGAVRVTSMFSATMPPEVTCRVYPSSGPSMMYLSTQL